MCILTSIVQNLIWGSSPKKTIQSVLDSVLGLRPPCGINMYGANLWARLHNVGPGTQRVSNKWKTRQVLVRVAAAWRKFGDRANYNVRSLWAQDLETLPANAMPNYVCFKLQRHPHTNTPDEASCTHDESLIEASFRRYLVFCFDTGVICSIMSDDSPLSAATYTGI